MSGALEATVAPELMRAVVLTDKGGPEVLTITEVPVLVRVGVANAQQAYEATRVADGVIQGASMVRRLIESGPDAVGDYVAEVRAAIDA